METFSKFHVLFTKTTFIKMEVHMVGFSKIHFQPNFGRSQTLDAIRMSEKDLKTGSGDLKKMVVFVPEPFPGNVLEYMKRMKKENDIQLEIISLSPQLTKDDFKGVLENPTNLSMLSPQTLESVASQLDTFTRTGQSISS